MSEKKLRVGIAGYGVVGKRRRNYIDQHPYMHTTAVCDQAFTQPSVMDEKVKSFPDYKHLLEEPLDVLFVCLPNYLAADVVIAGLQKGLHVFCEKPPACNVADVERVIMVEKENPSLLLKYGFNHRYHESVRDACRIIKSGELGEIINLRGVYGKSKIIQFSGGWRAERKYSGGGILIDQGIHMVDLVRMFCGEFSDVKSYISNDFWNHEVEDNAYVLMRDLRGRVTMLHSSATQWQHQFSLAIALSEGYLDLQGILSGSKSYGEERLTIGRRDESDTGTAREEIVRYLEDNSWKDEVYEFADTILRGGIIEYGGSADALATMKLVFRIYGADPHWKEKFNIESVD